ncbi:MAG: hypothetical protein LBQ66_14270 [Planctomycetaceae bacterium]|nr:hypothetical protein [Planctomycetaceae bacterium]
MQTKTKLFFKAIVLVMLVIGATGCKSNGGPWYSPGTYSLYNPFQLENHKDRVDSPTPSENNRIAKPHLEPRSDIRTPEGGYQENSGGNSLVNADTKLQRTNSYVAGTDYNHAAPSVHGTPGAFDPSTNGYVNTALHNADTYNTGVDQRVYNNSQPPVQPVGTQPAGGYSLPASYQTDQRYEAPPYNNYAPNSNSPTGNANVTPANYPGYPSGSEYPPTIPSNTTGSNPVAGPFAAMPASGQMPVAGSGGYAQPVGQYPTNPISAPAGAATPNNYGAAQPSNNPNPIPSNGGYSATPSAYNYGSGGF